MFLFRENLRNKSKIVLVFETFLLAFFQKMPETKII